MKRCPDISEVMAMEQKFAVGAKVAHVLEPTKPLIVRGYTADGQVRCFSPKGGEKCYPEGELKPFKSVVGVWSLGKNSGE
jgi:hypothetical protein